MQEYSCAYLTVTRLFTVFIQILLFSLKIIILLFNYFIFYYYLKCQKDIKSHELFQHLKMSLYMYYKLYNTELYTDWIYLDMDTIKHTKCM